jgi:hypothetical protein
MIACIDVNTLNIVSWYDGDVNKQSDWGGSLGDPASTLHIIVPEGLDPQCIMAVCTDDGTITLQTDPQKVEAKTTQAWTALRTERNARLAASDWTQLADVILSLEKQAWTDYRQSLRDLPELVTDPTQVEWPTPPS